jgi:hypothetical protein
MSSVQDFPFRGMELVLFVFSNHTFFEFRWAGQDLNGIFCAKEAQELAERIINFAASLMSSTPVSVNQFLLDDRDVYVTDAIKRHQDCCAKFLPSLRHGSPLSGSAVCALIG